MDGKETAQFAYEGYHQAKYAKDRTHTWIWWADLDENEQYAWREAAHAAIQKGWVESQPRRR